MRSSKFWVVAGVICLCVQAWALAGASQVELGAIYHQGWIDLNKNGQKDPYEDPNLDVEKRIDDLIGRMTVEEKTCQMATLYGYNRVLKDPLPTEGWRNQIWKDGIANIDEHLNGVRGSAIRGRITCASGSPRRTLNSITCGPRAVSIRPT